MAWCGGNRRCRRRRGAKRLPVAQRRLHFGMACARPQPITLEPHHRPGFAQFRIKRIGRSEEIVGEGIEGRNRTGRHRKSSMMDAASPVTMNNLTTFALTLKLRRRSPMSALGQKRTFQNAWSMSAIKSDNYFRVYGRMLVTLRNRGACHAPRDADPDDVWAFTLEQRKIEWSLVTYKSHVKSQANFCSPEAATDNEAVSAGEPIGDKCRTS